MGDSYKIIKNKTFKKVLFVTIILFIFTITYGFILWKYDLTLMNTYDYTYNKNPCFSDNTYKPTARGFVCMIYYEEIIIYKIFGNT